MSRSAWQTIYGCFVGHGLEGTSRNSVVLNRQQSRMGRAGLMTAIFSIVFAELYALFAAGARTPGVYQLLPGKDFFHVALVTHVNLAIVIWFLVFIGLLCLVSVVPWNIANDLWSKIGWGGILLCGGGMVLIVLAPFLGIEHPVMANYIPVITDPVFFAALLMVFLGAGMMMSYPFRVSIGSKKTTVLQKEFTFGMQLTVGTFLIAVICIVLAFTRLSAPYNTDYYEILFWGGGHILQFVNTLALLSCWIFLSVSVFQRLPMPSTTLRWLLASILLFALPAPFFYFYFPIYSLELRDAFTFLMRWGLGLAVIPVGLMIVRTSYQKRSEISWKNPCYTSLLVSILLFAYGGLIGVLIENSDVRIPAHYHGVIGAVTLAFMGASYELLPILRRKQVWSRFTRWQPLICGAGGILFVTGMFWAGAHGVARKVPGAGQGLDNLGKTTGMALMGIGGLVTVFGVVIYVVIILKSLQQPAISRAKAPAADVINSNMGELA